MKLYLNDECGILPDRIVGIFDMDGATVGDATKKFLSCKEKSGDMILATADIPVSFLVLSDAEGKKVYLTRNAPKVLARRARRCGL